MDKPTLTDYVTLIFTLFDQFEQQMMIQSGLKPGKPYTFAQKCFIVLFVIMQFRRIYQFKAQRRWLEEHPEMVTLLKWECVPHRTTFSRRYKALAAVLTAFIAFIGEQVADLGDEFANDHLVEDKSLFKAKGPVWHQSDRKADRIPEKLRHLDTDATWGKSAYQGWVYGYGLHLTCTEDAFPKLAQVETAAVNESVVIEEKSDTILNRLHPVTLAADNGYTKAMRIRNWAQQGVILLTPATKWVKGRFAQAYHRFIKETDNRQRLHRRRTSVEPLFDLIAQVLGCQGQHKQLPVQMLPNVRSCLTLATLTVQIAMIMNSMWHLPLRNVSHMRAVLS
jgi:hypothetical protein